MTRLLAILAALLMLVILYAFALWLLYEPKPYRPPEWTPAKKAWVVERMKYHGIDGAICEGNYCYFYRDRVRCRL